MKIWLYLTFLAYQTISFAKLPEKLSLCITCHGKDGIALQKTWPNLNGQSQNYIIKQLQDYKSNKRIAPLMQPYAMLLNDQEMLELAQFYANLPHETSKTNKSNRLYQQGDAKKRIPACSACHGPKGLGNDFAKFPKLAGQNAPYLLAELQAFKKHERQNDSYHMMQDISQRMSKEDMKNISEYLSKNL
jgi:cytochrome c553